MEIIKYIENILVRRRKAKIAQLKARAMVINQIIRNGDGDLSHAIEMTNIAGKIAYLEALLLDEK
jgi:hypothetical protein